MTRRRSAGFTLVELMIAMTILGMVLLLGYSGLHLGMRHWHAVQRQGQALQEQRRLSDFFRLQLGHAVSLQSLEEERTPFFRGDPREMQFLAPLEAAPEGGGLYLFRIRTEPSRLSSGTLQLLVDYQPYDPDRRRLEIGGSAEGAKQLIVAETLRSVEFSFFGATALVKQPRWHRQWQEVERLPELVKLRITGSQGEPWEDYVIPLRSGGAL